MAPVQEHRSPFVFLGILQGKVFVSGFLVILSYKVAELLIDLCFYIQSRVIIHGAIGR